MTARGIRNNNPGNIDFNPRMFNYDPWVGELGIEDHPDARFTTFDTPTHGIRALCKILLTYDHHRKGRDGSPIDTVQEYIDRWAPPIENDTKAYASAVRKMLDVDAGETIDMDDPRTLTIFARAVIRQENGRQPYDDTIIAEAVRLALA